MFASNQTIFDIFSDSIELSTYCLKLILEEKKKQRFHSVLQSLEQTTVPLIGQESNPHPTEDCMKHLKGFNNTILLELIREVTNISSVSHIRGHDTELEFPFVNEWYVVTIWSLLFISMVLFAIFGNSIIIWIILRQKIMRTVINIFLLNLTLSDLLTVSFNATFNFVFMLTGHWPFTHVYCVINNFITNLTIVSSVFTATVMSIDRYIAIVYPLKPRMSRKRALINITIIWLCSIFFASPTIIFSKTITIPYNTNNERTLCILEWPDGLSGQSKYNIAFLLLTYILPMLTMAIAYTLMARVLWDSRQNELNSNIQKEVIKSKQKCVLMLIAMISLFGICWLPYHCYFLCTYFWPQIIKFKVIKHIYLAIYWLAMANSLFDPIILFIMNKRFRNCIKYYIRCECFIGGHFEFVPRTIPGSPMQMNMIQMMPPHNSRELLSPKPPSHKINYKLLKNRILMNRFSTQV